MVIFTSSLNHVRTSTIDLQALFQSQFKLKTCHMLTRLIFYYTWHKETRLTSTVVARKATRGLCCWLFESVNCMENFFGEPPSPPAQPLPPPSSSLRIKCFAVKLLLSQLVQEVLNKFRSFQGFHVFPLIWALQSSNFNWRISDLSYFQ